MKPRLLLVGPLPPPVGGVETVTQAVLESDAFNEFEVRHCNTTKGRPKQTQGKFDLGNYWWALRHFYRMWRDVRSFRPNAVYMAVASTWSGFLRDSVLARVGQHGRAKVVGHVHGATFHEILERGGRDAARVRRAVSLFDALLVLGTRWKELVDAYGFRGKTFIVPSTLRRETFERGAAFRRAHKTSGSIGGLFVGQVGKRKGVFDLMPAMQRVKAQRIPFRLTFVGPAELEGEWESAMQARDDHNVKDVTEFTGPLMGESLYERFRSGDLFIMPSYDEGLPVVFFEAGAFEMPVVATPVGAIPDLIEHGRNGLLVEPGNIDQIVKAIKRLTEDHEARIRMGIQLKKDIERFHPDRVCALVADAVRQTLGAK